MSQCENLDNELARCQNRQNAIKREGKIFERIAYR